MSYTVFIYTMCGSFFTNPAKGFLHIYYGSTISSHYVYMLNDQLCAWHRTNKNALLIEHVALDRITSTK